MEINSNNYSVVEILQMLDRKELTVNRKYQRGSGIWPKGPSSYFIDTILEDYPFPKIYMFEYLDRINQQMKKEIVDGQQRIGTIQRFFRNDLRLIGDTRFAGRIFEELEQADQDNFLSYTISVDVIRGARESEILQMFRRMNAFTLPLNESEKRHSSFQGEFKWFINSLADDFNEFFLEFGVFNNRQIVRMSDSALLADIILALEQGVISSSPKALRALYGENDEVFHGKEEYLEKLSDAIRFISTELENLRGSHMMKPYALHSLIVALIFNKYGANRVRDDLQCTSMGQFSNNPDVSAQLLELAQAHEAKELEGPHRNYVWGSISTTDRKVRRTARMCSILRMLGNDVPREVDQDIVPNT